MNKRIFETKNVINSNNYIISYVKTVYNTIINKDNVKYDNDKLVIKDRVYIFNINSICNEHKNFSAPNNINVIKSIMDSNNIQIDSYELYKNIIKLNKRYVKYAFSKYGINVPKYTKFMNDIAKASDIIYILNNDDTKPIITEWYATIILAYDSKILFNKLRRKIRSSRKTEKDHIMNLVIINDALNTYLLPEIVRIVQHIYTEVIFYDYFYFKPDI
jgi:hypothetical protein